MQEKLIEHGITSAGRTLETTSSATDIPTISAEDLDELMGGGGEVATLPAGMSFEEAGDAPEDATEQDAGELALNDYEDE